MSFIRLSLMYTVFEPGTESLANKVKGLVDQSSWEVVVLVLSPELKLNFNLTGFVIANIKMN